MQFVQSYQKPIGLFLDLNTAENALNELLKTGFSEEKISLIPRALNPHPPIQDTEAAKSAKIGAIVGMVGGGLLGFLLGYITLKIFSTEHVHPFAHLIRTSLVGSVIGAAYTTIIGAFSGANVPKALVEPKYYDAATNYLIIAQGTPEELMLAQEILQQHGAKELT